MMIDTFTPLIEESIKLVVMMNNVGVSLFEEGSYRQANATFNNALHLLLNMQGSSNNMYIHPKPTARRIAISDRKAKSPFLFHTIKDTDSLTLPSGDAHSSHDGVLYPVIIDTKNVAEKDVNVTAAIVCHNLASSFLLLARLAPAPSTATRLRMSATKLFHVVDTLVSKRQRQDDRALKIATLTLRSLVQASTTNDDTHDLNISCSSLSLY